MTVSCQTVVTRALAFSAMNTGLAADRGEMLSRIRHDQQALFSTIASVTRDRFQTTGTLTSTNGSTPRSVDLADLALPVERVLLVSLPSGEEVSQVDVLDVDAELAPRYRVRGTTLLEIENDWDTTTTSAVILTVDYVYGATDIDPDGAYTQLVSVPDAWVDLLALPLAMYFVQKDAGRDPGEYERLNGLLVERRQAFLSYLTTYGGTVARRFDIPTPTPEQKG